MTGRGDHVDPALRSPSRAASFRNAFDGFAALITGEPNACVHAVFTVGVVVLGAWLHLSALAWALLILAIGQVWIAEMINTALEATIDLTSPTLHPLARLGKDVAAAAVLVSALTSVGVGLCVLGPPLWARVAPFLSDAIGQ